MIPTRVMAPLLVVRLVGQAIAAWWNDNLMRLGASVAYYTPFAIAPILLLWTRAQSFGVVLSIGSCCSCRSRSARHWQGWGRGWTDGCPARRWCCKR